MPHGNASYPTRARVLLSLPWGMTSPPSSRPIQAAFLKFKTAILTAGREVARHNRLLAELSRASHRHPGRRPRRLQEVPSRPSSSFAATGTAAFRPALLVGPRNAGFPRRRPKIGKRHLDLGLDWQPQ